MSDFCQSDTISSERILIANVERYQSKDFECALAWPVGSAARYDNEQAELFSDWPPNKQTGPSLFYQPPLFFSMELVNEEFLSSFFTISHRTDWRESKQNVEMLSSLTILYSSTLIYFREGPLLLNSGGAEALLCLFFSPSSFPPPLFFLSREILSSGEIVAGSRTQLWTVSEDAVTPFYTLLRTL